MKISQYSETDRARFVRHWDEVEQRLEALLERMRGTWRHDDISDVSDFIYYSEFGCAVDLMDHLGRSFGWLDQHDEFLRIRYHMRSFEPRDPP